MTIKESAVTKGSGVAIMGGTFNPIHNGHLRTAVEVLEKFEFSSIRLLPCFQPVHKNSPSASPSQRLDMVALAANSCSKIAVDSREIERQGPSYSVDSLKEIREEVGPDEPIIMVLGMDSFLSLSTWHKWQELIQYAHLLVVSRPGWEPDFISELESFYENHRAPSSDALQCAPSGLVWLETLTPLAVSSSMIRKLAFQHRSIAYLLPESVQQYIERNKLYQ
ncbi:nicotinate-nucleotide adenylyltransferase [Marinomonas sp. C2222]|uniref:Probable nicotinate-nucleotide adenylyltransferase n=1 Tax=Marinomonas sargassi TaxID=2984494 RepID=A0ABT2YR40_9GAMM|nr:nicotinate-nucleotide adenylyltransferase [Marinomonas sargassi]MCV2402347.1 nicotinate-nucleotide adenylyltransferase [Marinomonas sargassi]